MTGGQPKFLFFFLVASLVLSGCGLFGDEQVAQIKCEDKNLTGEVIHVSASNGFDNYISALNADNLEEIYQIKGMRSQSNNVRYFGNVFFYTYSQSSTESALLIRAVQEGELVDSLALPKGSILFKVNDYYISYGGAIPHVIIDNEIIIKDFGYRVQEFHHIGGQSYGIYGNPGELLFGRVNASKIPTAQDHMETITDLTSLVEEVVPNFGLIYSMYYLEEKNRLLMTVENFANPPLTILIDINLDNGKYKAIKTGDHAYIFPAVAERFFFMSHRVSYRLNAKPARYLRAYDSRHQIMVNIIDFEQAIGGSVYIQDIASDGCYLYAGILLLDSEGLVFPLLIKYDLKNHRIEQIKELGFLDGFQGSIRSVSISSNPKLN